MNEQRKSKMIEVLSANSSKEKELAWLRKVADAAGNQSYMSGLFSGALIEWCYWQVHDDLPCDIMTECMSRTAEISGLNSQIKELRNELVMVKQLHQHALDEQADKMVTAQALIDNLSNDIADFRAEKDGLLEQRGDLQHEIISQAQTIAALELTVMELKAKLYDLTVAG